MATYLVTSPFPVCLPPDGRQASPGEQVSLPDRTATDLIALGHLTALQAAPKSTQQPARDAAPSPKE